MSHSILIVDDEKPIRDALRRALLPFRYQLLEADNGASALDILSRSKVDLVISDQNMPGMSGLDLLKKVTEQDPSIVRIMLTGYGDMQQAVSAVRDETLFYLLKKPWDLDELELILSIGLRYGEMQKENLRLLKLVKEQRRIIEDLESR